MKYISKSKVLTADADLIDNFAFEVVSEEGEIFFYHELGSFEYHDPKMKVFKKKRFS